MGGEAAVLYKCTRYASYHDTDDEITSLHFFNAYGVKCDNCE